MTLQALVRKLKDADALHTAEVWVRIGNSHYLVSDVHVDLEGDIEITTQSTPY